MAAPRRNYRKDEPRDIRHQWPYVDDELLKTLPTVLRAVVKALGYGRAQQWLREYGGVNVYVPQFREQAMDLEPEELDRLRCTLEPHMDVKGRVAMPKADKLFLRTRDEQIRKDRHRSSIRDLARRNNLSSRQITNICREVDDRQFDLF